MRPKLLTAFAVLAATVLLSLGLGAPASTHTGAGAATAAPAEEPPSTADEYVVASLAAEAGISREEAARRLESQGANAELAERLGEQLGNRAAGAYLDRGTGNLVVNVLDDTAAEEVRAAGATPRTVRYSLADLEHVAGQLDPDGEAGRAGYVISIGVDVEANAVEVTIPASAQENAGRFLEHLRTFGAMTEIQVSSDPSPQFAYTVYAGGHGFTSTFSCTAGLAAKDTYNNRYMLTAQHCVAANDPVLVSGQLFGWRWYNSPAYETATIRNWFPATFDQLPRVWTWNGSYVVVKGSYNTLQYSYVCKSGMTTGWTCGYVAATGLAMWSWESGTYVYNLTRAKLCGVKGDSGGPVVATAGVYWYATGIWSTTNSPYTCTASTLSYYVPIAAALSHTGLSLVTG